MTYANKTDLSDNAIETNISNSVIENDLSDNALGGIAYLPLIPAIVYRMMEPFKKISNERFHAWQSIFFFTWQAIFFLFAWAIVDVFAKVMENDVPAAVLLTLAVLQLAALAVFITWLFKLTKSMSSGEGIFNVPPPIAWEPAHR